MPAPSTAAVHSNRETTEHRNNLPQGQPNEAESLKEQYIRAAEQFARAEKKIRQMTRLYATLSQTNHTIVRVKEQDLLFRTICEVAVRFGEFSHAWIGILDETTGDVHPVAATGLDVDNWPLPIVNIHTGPLTGGLVTRALLTSKLITSGNVQADPHLQILRDRFLKNDHHSSAAIPICLRGKTIGTLTLMSKEVGLFEDAEEVRLLDEIGADISFALENMENEKERKRVEDELLGSKAKLESALANMTDAEKALRESQERYRLIAENAEDMIWTMNLSLQLTYVSPAVERALGYPAQEIQSATPEQFLTAESFAAGMAVFNEEVQNAQMQPNPNYARLLELEYRRKDGSTFWVEMKFSFFRDSNGFPTGVLGVGREITERQKAEENLRQSEERYRLISENSADVIWVLDPMGMRFTYVSPSVEKLRGYTPAEVMAQPVSASLTPESLQLVSEVLATYLPEFLAKGTGTASFVNEVDQPCKDGSIVHTEVITTAMFNPQGQVEILGVTRDITARKKAQDDLRLLNLELERRVLERTLELSHANRAKDEFLANMSHELRTPLNTVLGLSESLLEQRRGPLNTRQIESVELIAASGQHLLGLINDILEVSKIEAGKLELRPSLVSVKELCESSLHFIKEPALRKLISVEFHSDGASPMVYGDPQRLKQILINLLTNAVKFTPERGQVSLHVSMNDERDQILFLVADTGIGIAAADLKKLFTPFTQLDSSLARQHAGTGLGLALVQKLTDLHGGCVHVESEVDRGSRFTVVLPANQKVDEQAPKGMNEEDERVKQEPRVTSSVPDVQNVILLAEDNAVNSAMLAGHLEEHGYKVLQAQDGEDALLKASESIPMAILMDIQMPKMDGLEATRRLRMDARFAATPIIALTALAMPGDKERCLQAGASEYMSKPVSLKNLLQTIHRLMKADS